MGVSRAATAADGCPYQGGVLTTQAISAAGSSPAPPRLEGATSRHLGRSRVLRSCVSSPVSRWRAVAVLERPAECRLRRVADVLRDERDRKGGAAEQVNGGVQAIASRIRASCGRHTSSPSSPSSAGPRAPRRMITAGRLASRWHACGSPIVNVPQSQRAGSRASFSVAPARTIAARACLRR